MAKAQKANTTQKPTKTTHSGYVFIKKIKQAANNIYKRLRYTEKEKAIHQIENDIIRNINN